MIEDTTRPICSVEGCDRLALYRPLDGLCHKHYMRWKRLGTTTLVRELPCMIEGCDDKAGDSGLCGFHRSRRRRYGDPLGGPRYRRRRDATVEEKFWANINKNGPVPAHRPELSSCWVWMLGHYANGYGIVYGSGEGDAHTQYRTHRVAYELCVGPIPEGLEIDHLCLNHGCCNPDHLEAVTHAENGQRAWDTGCQPERLPLTHCRRGHEMTPENSYFRKDCLRGECRECRKMAGERHRLRRKGNLVC